MHAPYFDQRLDASALSPVLQLTAVVLSLVIAGVFLFEVLAGAGLALVRG